MILFRNFFRIENFFIGLSDAEFDGDSESGTLFQIRGREHGQKSIWMEGLGGLGGLGAPKP